MGKDGDVLDLCLGAVGGSLQGAAGCDAEDVDRLPGVGVAVDDEDGGLDEGVGGGRKDALGLVSGGGVVGDAGLVHSGGAVLEGEHGGHLVRIHRVAVHVGDVHEVAGPWHALDHRSRRNQ